jgi:hypothetical protein
VPKKYIAGRTKMAMAPWEPGDGDTLVGGIWTREALIEMDVRFCAAMQAALERGSERLPSVTPARAA